MLQQIGRCYQTFLKDFVANCSTGVWVSWKIQKVQKDEALNHHWNQEKATNKVV